MLSSLASSCNALFGIEEARLVQNEQPVTGSSGSSGQGDCASAIADGGQLSDCAEPCLADAGAGVCGCGIPDTDGDGDGVPDCLDECPNDTTKDAPGACGCGSPDSDSDSDGTLDCMDACPEDENKQSPGDCGCGQADLDTDGDGTPDCLDECPEDEAKTQPQVCGCGHAEDKGADGEPLCAPLLAGLAHRYSFDVAGTVAFDRAGSADGTLVDVMLDGSGSLELNADGYLDLPNDLLLNATDISIEVFFNWRGGSSWQRLFDFGSSTAAEGEPAEGESYLFFAPTGTSDMPTLALKPRGGDELRLLGAALTANLPTHIVVVLDDTGDELRLYQMGELVNSVSVEVAVADIDFVNNWIGRSQFVTDPGLSASIDELRIYNAALPRESINYSRTLGPDTTLFIDVN
jgi:hypothetical protein